MHDTRTWIFRGAAIVVALWAAIYVLRPRPIPVDVAPIGRGPLTVTVADDGETRVREVYLVSAPLPGRVLRFAGDVGDTVVANDTIIASILPSDPILLDARRRSELESQLEAAEAGRALATAEVTRIEAELEYARSDFERARALAARGIVSRSELDRARKDARTREAALQTTRAALRVRDHELATVRALLMDPATGTQGAADARQTDGCCLEVRAPVSGRILRIFHESEGVVAAGAPLVEVGEPTDLEIVLDLLSTDAVRVTAGDTAMIERWGGDGILTGLVRRVEPYGFTKVSALGIEEQRVNVIIDITDPIEKWQRLGHGYRVDVQIVLWREASVLRVPVAALFREQDAWAAFTVEDGRARLRTLELGKMNERYAQVLDGLTERETVILHPSDRVLEDVRVVARAHGRNNTTDASGSIPAAE